MLDDKTLVQANGVNGTDEGSWGSIEHETEAAPAVDVAGVTPEALQRCLGEYAPNLVVDDGPVQSPDHGITVGRFDGKERRYPERVRPVLDARRGPVMLHQGEPFECAVWIWSVGRVMVQMAFELPNHSLLNRAGRLRGMETGYSPLKTGPECPTGVALPTKEPLAGEAVISVLVEPSVLVDEFLPPAYSTDVGLEDRCYWENAGRGRRKPVIISPTIISPVDLVVVRRLPKVHTPVDAKP